jgi:predicted DsbA family dithiol-disulfide isomerase
MKLHIYFDYTCPFCYIGESQIKSALKSFPEVEPAWHPFELRPKPTDRPQMLPDPETGEYWDPALKAEAEKEGLAMGKPFSPVPYTDRAFQGMHYVASNNGDVQAYNERVFKAVFDEGRDIADIEVLTDVAKELGMDADSFNKAIKEGVFKDAQQRALRHAYFESGVDEIPTCKIMKIRISGAVGKATIEKFIMDGLKEAEKEKEKALDDGTTPG